LRLADLGQPAPATLYSPGPVRGSMIYGFERE
jgi:hypothetical protein